MSYLLGNGTKITLVKWIKSIRGNQYFVAKDENNNECIFYVKSRDENDNIVEIERVK
jgi:hypothetical protein